VAGEIPITNQGGVYVVPIKINNAIVLEGIIDSGAAEVNLPADVVLTLIRANTISTSDFLDDETYVLADGSKVPSKRLKLRQIKIGDVELKDVSASVGDVRGSILIGQSLLERFSEWAFDNKKHVLRIK
jgi:clan AA aspartic protease (TIGR02281 family)